MAAVVTGRFTARQSSSGDFDARARQHVTMAEKRSHSLRAYRQDMHNVVERELSFCEELTRRIDDKEFVRTSLTGTKNRSVLN